MNGEWCFFKNRFSEAHCNFILQEGLKLPVQEALIGGRVDTSYRRSKIRFIHREPKFEFLFDEIWKMAIDANDQWFGFHLSRLSYVQLAEYSSTDNGEYKKHHDVFWLNNDPYYHRKLTCVIQLTNPNEYEGGNFEIYDLNCNPPDTKDTRSRGTAIFIPSFMPHAALPVTKGTRYSLAVWIEGPKWR